MGKWSLRDMAVFALVACLVGAAGCGGSGLKGRTPDERAIAASRLGVERKDENIPILLKAVSVEPETVQTAAIGALGRIGTTKAVEALGTLKNHESTMIRKSVAQTLQDVLPEAYPDAARVLVEIGNTALPKGPGNDPLRALRSSVTTSLCVVKQREGIDFLLGRALGDPDENIRNASVKTLGRVKDPKSVDTLMRIAGEDTEKNRAWAIEAMGEIGDARALPVVKKAMSDPDPVTRGKAAWATMQLGGKDVIGDLEAALAVEQNDMPAVVEAHALALLGRADAVSFLEDRLVRAGQFTARAEAARVLGEVGRRESIPLLDRAFDEDRDGLVKREAGLAVRKLFAKFPGEEEKLGKKLGAAPQRKGKAKPPAAAKKP